MYYENEIQQKEFTRLARLEGWDLTTSPVDGSTIIIADGREFPLLHPYQIHLRLYRDGTVPEVRLQHMIKVHNMLWPEHVPTNNYWQERIFAAHCERWKQVVLAGGASVGKSVSAAKVALIFWLSDPTRNACLVASTTLDSLESRIWGYVIKFAEQSALKIPVRILEGKPQKLVYPGQVNKLHGMFATAIKQGADTKVINNLIGRHPEKGLLIVLDEATDMPPAIMQAIPNLEEVSDMFQLIAIGNSSSKSDLHGALATPKIGWKHIDPNKDFAWETTHPGGICLYFNPHNSPAIHDPDPVKRALLGKFLINKKKLAEKIAAYGTDSDSYYRFVLGFWRMVDLAESAMSPVFLEEHHVVSQAEWLGVNPLYGLAGLDPAYRLNSKGCILRLALWGQAVTGRLTLDYRKEELLFRLKIAHSLNTSVELQIANQVVEILKQYNIPLKHLAIDVTGAGRAIPELIRIVYQTADYALKVVASGRMSSRRRDSLETQDNLISFTPTDMWMAFKEFAQQDHIRGLDPITLQQITSRKLITKEDGTVLIEPKQDYISRMAAIDAKLGHSPDEADAAILVLVAAVQRLGFTPGMQWAVPDLKALNQFAREKMEAYMRQQKVGIADRLGFNPSSSIHQYPLVADFSGTTEDGLYDKRR